MPIIKLRPDSKAWYQVSFILLGLVATQGILILRWKAGVHESKPNCASIVQTSAHVMSTNILWTKAKQSKWPSLNLRGEKIRSSHSGEGWGWISDKQGSNLPSEFKTGIFFFTKIMFSMLLSKAVQIVDSVPFNKYLLSDFYLLVCVRYSRNRDGWDSPCPQEAQRLGCLGGSIG